MSKWLKNTWAVVQIRWIIYKARRPKNYGWTIDKPGKDLNRKPWGY